MLLKIAGIYFSFLDKHMIYYWIQKVSYFLKGRTYDDIFTEEYDPLIYRLLYIYDLYKI